MSECDDYNEGVCDFLDPELTVNPSMQFIVLMFEVLSEVDEYFDRCECCDFPDGLKERVKDALKGAMKK